MRSDPIRPNFCENTGGYLWQVAEYLGRSTDDHVNAVELVRPAPPELRHASEVAPKALHPESIVRWSPSVQHATGRPRLIGGRGKRTDYVINPEVGSFVEVDVALYETVTVGIRVRDLPWLRLSGVSYSAPEVLVGMIRHGLVESDESWPHVEPTKALLEPTCSIFQHDDGRWIASNVLTGRVVSINKPAWEFLSECRNGRLFDTSLRGAVSTFVRAGMVRLIAEGTPL